MLPTGQGSIRIFQVAGINVFLHWSWFLVAAFEVTQRKGAYSSMTWNGFEYLALFAIVLTHEFGHALACRQVGGTANQIVLWPLGGVAYVSPPPRPGAILWSIAAGPLVNVVLAPLLFLLLAFARSNGWEVSHPDAYKLLRTTAFINFVLLAFNILPIYPLDGGQILRSLLWFMVGPARSLAIAAAIGFIGVAGLIFLAVEMKSIWIGIMALFIGMNCWRGWVEAGALSKAAKAPRHPGFVCPACQQAARLGPIWRCAECKNGFDPFASQAVCPHCGARFAAIPCLECGAHHEMREWMSGPAVPPPLRR